LWEGGASVKGKKEVLLRSPGRPVIRTANYINITAGCPGKWWSHHPWSCSKNMWALHFRMWYFSTLMML